MTSKRALISVSDKTGIADLATQLVKLGFEIISTGGTAKLLKEAGIEVKAVADITGQPEILGGRVKTLHPRVHGGLLADKNNADHMAQMVEHDITAIDLLVVNLYPFRQTLASGADFDTCIENIDIGGPAMIRASAKNHESILVVTDPSDYASTLEALASDAANKDFRRKLALKAFQHTAAYDAAISAWLSGEVESDTFPAELTVTGAKIGDLRYGENPHQQAAWYASGAKPTGLPAADLIQGKPLSYNNINDADAALALVQEFDEPAVAIIKHANPCGVATSGNLMAAYGAALDCDPVSAFGGIVAMNRDLDAELAAKITEIFTEVVIAPAASDEAKAIFAKKPNLRLLITTDAQSAPALKVKAIAGGLLVQTADDQHVNPEALKCVTKTSVAAEQEADLDFAFKVAKHVKSNAIVLAKAGATVGIGAGQMSRVDSARVAREKAGVKALGSVLASDAFFPFADGIEMAQAAGATAIIQPGGSMRDEEVIAAADAAGIAMVFTGIRHFNH